MSIVVMSGWTREKKTKKKAARDHRGCVVGWAAPELRAKDTSRRGHLEEARVVAFAVAICETKAANAEATII